MMAAAAFIMPAQGARDPINAMLVQVNEARAHAGLGELRFDRRLAVVAQRQSGILATRGRLSHEAGGSLDKRVRQAGFRYWMIAENLAAGIADPAMVVSSWLRSSGHRENLLRPDAEVAGVGYVAQGKRYGHYWTLIVADPAR